MNILFENHNGQERIIGNCQSFSTALEIVYDFCKERNYKIPYTRYWLSDIDQTSTRLHMDCGSHTEFFYIVMPYQRYTLEEIMQQIQAGE